MTLAAVAIAERLSAASEGLLQWILPPAFVVAILTVISTSSSAPDGLESVLHASRVVDVAAAVSAFPQSMWLILSTAFAAVTALLLVVLKARYAYAHRS